jgi:uncharacterized protein (DUF885 family)
VINTSRLEDRRLMSEAIAFHEGIPGHHLQAAMAESSGGYVAGFAEGWAVYAERLAAEMGLYGSRLDRTGLWAKRLWAASRLVVEPGLHLHGWSREEAIAFMLTNTALPRAEIEVEVDRYLALPGQSLSYMLGNLELRRLRRRAEERLGDAFDPRAFHRVVLRPGSRPLPEVAADVEAWIEDAGWGRLAGRTGPAAADDDLRPDLEAGHPGIGRRNRSTPSPAIVPGERRRPVTSRHREPRCCRIDCGQP